MARTHLFLAMGNHAFGEVVLGIRLARALVERGDRVLFLAPSGQAVLFKEQPFRYGQIDRIWNRIDEGVVDVIASEQCDDVVLIDLASVFLGLAMNGLQQRFLSRVDVPLVAMDVWDLPRTGLRWDALGETWMLPAEALQVTRRIVPVPFGHLDTRGGYDGLPPVAPIDRARQRAALGLGERDRLLLTATAAWQTAKAQPTPRLGDAVTLLQSLLVDRLRALGDRVQVVHVGPEPLAGDTTGLRYEWRDRLPAARFLELLGAADLVVSLNQSATTAVSAVAHGVPVLVAINSFGGSSAEVAAALGEPASPALVQWLERAAPLQPFRIWPLGLHRFLRPLFTDNPYTDALATVELLPEGAFTAACTRLLFDDAAAAALRARQAAYCAAVRRLPSPADAFEACLR